MGPSVSCGFWLEAEMFISKIFYLFLKVLTFKHLNIYLFLKVYFVIYVNIF